MKAKIKPRIDLENRTALETVIPLTTPFIINVDPSEKCNFHCKFCPTGDKELMANTPGRNVGAMDMSLFKKIVDDLAQFDKPIKVLRLYKDGEPLLNKNFAAMVRYAKESGYCERVDTTTNASALTRDRALEIADSGLDRMNISIYGLNTEQYKSFSGNALSFDKLVENVRFFYEHRKNCEMIVKINGDLITKEEVQRFYDIFGDIADGVYVESIMSCWPEFDLRGGYEANQKNGIYKQEIKEVLVCPYVFYSFSINSDGSASACYLDWSRDLQIGDVKSQSVKDIWSGIQMITHQRMMLNGNRKDHPVCKNCGQLSHGMPDNIDKYAKSLIANFPSE